jgi:hypothetical protein
MWFVILNNQDTVLAVFGGALKDMVDKKLEEILKVGPARIIEWHGERPHVGQVMS